MDDDKRQRRRQAIDRQIREAEAEGIDVLALLAHAIDAESRLRTWREEAGVRDESALSRKLEDLIKPGGPFTPAGAAFNSPTFRSVLLDLWDHAERGAPKRSDGVRPLARLEAVADAFPHTTPARVKARQRKTRHRELVLSEVRRLADELQRLYHLKRPTAATIRRLDDLRFLSEDGYWCHFDPVLLLDSVRRIKEQNTGGKPAFQRKAAAMLELDAERLERFKDGAKKRRKRGQR